MSDLPGEMTKQSFSAPPRTSRSIRYSLTARGRSRSPSRRLPTGSSSLENASGCMRLPCPAAGMIPHMVPHDRDELAGTDAGAVFGERALTRTAADPPAHFGVEVEGRGHVVGGARDEDLAIRFEELFEAVPAVRQHRRAAGRRLEQAARRAEPHRSHRAPRHVEREIRRRVERGMLGWRLVTEIVDVGLPRKAGRRI